MPPCIIWLPFSLSSIHATPTMSGIISARKSQRFSTLLTDDLMRHKSNGHARQQLVLVLQTKLLQCRLDSGITVKLFCISSGHQELINTGKFQESFGYKTRILRTRPGLLEAPRIYRVF